MSEARVRLAAADDAPAIADIHIRSWRATYRGLVPDAILDGLSMERRVTSWREAIAGQERDLAAGSGDGDRADVGHRGDAPARRVRGIRSGPR
jgi:hypothetical protein